MAAKDWSEGGASANDVSTKSYFSQRMRELWHPSESYGPSLVVLPALNSKSPGSRLDRCLAMVKLRVEDSGLEDCP